MHVCKILYYENILCNKKKIIGRDYVRAIVQINADVLFAYYFHFRKIFINLKNLFFKDTKNLYTYASTN